MRSVALTNIADPPVSLTLATAWLRVDHGDDDDIITDLIAEAVSEVERRTGRLLREATGEMTLSELPQNRESIALPFGKLRSVTSFSYVATSGDSTDLTPHTETKSLPGQLLPPTGTSWPETQSDNAAAATIVFECGAVPDETQKELIGCIKLMLDLAYHDNSPQKMARLEQRRDAIIKRWSIRDARLAGVTYN